MGTRGHMKVSTFAAIVAAVTGSAAAVVTCKAPSEPSGSPGTAPQDAMASDASHPVSVNLRPQLSGDAGPVPSYLNEPDIWTGTQLQQFFHLSEGSEVFPYGGLLAIYSADAT